MIEYNVSNPAQALAYITDCNMATVEEMATKKSRNKREYKRQINIAQIAIDWMIEMKVDMSGTRAEKICEENGKVSDWVKQYEV